MSNVLITGGSRGIGAACVRAFAARGDKVWFIYERNEAAAGAVARETGAVALKADVSLRASLERVMLEARDVDVLVNCAGIAQFRMFQDISEAEFRRMMDVNVWGAFSAAQLVAPGMISRRRGSIVNVSSIWGISGASCEVHYSTAKAALIGFTKALAKELGPSGVRVNCVAPGAIETDMNQSLTADELRLLADDTPLGRIGTPDEVARAVVFLASDDSSFITGQVLSPNGGIVV